MAFSEAVVDAYKKGYTEPDPRDDLSGCDVARKALILARSLGWQAEMKDIALESLFPPRMAGLTVEGFLAALPELDAGFRSRVREAEQVGQVLRYAATLEAPAGGNHHKISVRLCSFPRDSNLGRLRGTANMVEFVTASYPQGSSLVVRGAGAGAGITANGVVADLVAIAANFPGHSG